MSEERIIETTQEKYFLETISLIKKITSGKLSYFYREAIEDVVQKVSLNLWKWKQQKDVVQEGVNLTQEEWFRLANTAVNNEIKSFYQSRMHREIPIQEVEDHDFRYLKNNFSNISGNTNIEINSLLTLIWNEIRLLSLRQKYSFILQKEELIVDLIRYGCCVRKDIAHSLNFDCSEFDIILSKLPLSDKDIKEIIEIKLKTQITIKQIWRARNKAKQKLYVGLRDKT